ncbi:MAG: ABC transporter ATP-binding protein [Magnetococcales bacterium]|nr:ABC transporter ATP-binding protein [Magnetococcales bacterium]
MLDNLAIKARGVGKEYLLGTRHAEDFRSALTRLVTAPWRLLTGQRPSEEASRRFWALQGIDLDIPPGEVVGIIGRNGAGKSTLLKVISRITEPTCGRIEVRGRLGTLLEVGTGFHPELTGRENIFLNGAVLGMSRREITRKFDEIVAFSEVETFLDTPVKRYSSGMYVRLAFAVAAHLDPEILLVDEVLAVGDARFQKKCLGRMQEVSQEGRTVLFVSHSMSMILSLCSRAVLLERGRIVADGRPGDVVLSYYKSDDGQGAASCDFTRRERPAGNDTVRLLHAAVRDENGDIAPEVDIDKPFTVTLTYEILKHSPGQLHPNIRVNRSDGSMAFFSICSAPPPKEPGVHRAVCHIPGNFFNDGPYFIDLAISSFHSLIRDHVLEYGALCLSVRDPIEGCPTRCGYAGEMPGSLRPLLLWQVEADQRA